MIELDTSYSLSQIPYITYDALDSYAEELVNGFVPQLIENPGVLDVDSFSEYYLRLSVEFRRICLNRKVLGVTVFNGGVVDVICDETGHLEKIRVETGTVIIDPSLNTKRNVPRLRFTMLHEASHWLLHRRAFAEDNPFGPAGMYENQFLAAKEGRADYSRSLKEKTDVERMERQADFLASALMMNRPALRVAFKNFFELHGDKPRRIVRGASPLDDCYARQLTEYIAELFGASKRAALIRLEKLTAIVDKGRHYG